LNNLDDSESDSEEQVAITAFIDRETAKIDALIAEQRRLIDLLKEKRQAVISHAVTKGLDPSAPMKDSGIEWLGEVPAHWHQKRIKDICLEVVDCKNRTPNRNDNGEFFVVRTSCIRNGKFDPSQGYYTSESEFLEWTRKGLPRIGDILFTREAPAGEACLAPEDLSFCLGQRMMYFRPDFDQIFPDFLLHLLYGPQIRQYIQSRSKGSTVGHLRVGEVHALPCLVPSLGEQEAISRTLKSLFKDFDSLIFEAQRAIDLLTERRAALISDAVTGKIDLRNLARTSEAA